MAAVAVAAVAVVAWPVAVELGAWASVPAGASAAAGTAAARASAAGQLARAGSQPRLGLAAAGLACRRPGSEPPGFGSGSAAACCPACSRRRVGMECGFIFIPTLNSTMTQGIEK